MPGAPIDASTDAQERLILDLAGNRLDRSELADGEDNAMRRGQNGDKNDKGASGETANPSSCLWLRGAGFEPATFGL